MAYRAPELVVPADDPFLNDRLDRKGAVEFVAGLIKRAGGPFVVALDGPWGTGKSTFVRMLDAHLTKEKFQCVNFNAWEVDYVTDPLVAMVSAIDQITVAGQSAATFREHLKTVKKVTALVAKRGVVAALKAVTVGALNIDAEVEAVAAEFAGGSFNDVVESFQKEKELLAQFRSELEQAIRHLPENGKQEALVFFVDELDRCRPTFAVELLERVKHIFSLQNMIFVLAIDKAQLEASVAAIYGNKINAAEYLRRFIDIDFSIPQAKGAQFIEGLITSFKLDEFFAKRTHSELASDRSQFTQFFALLADVFQLSLRARERCFTRMRLVIEQTPTDHYLDPILVALLVILRAKEPEIYAALVGGELSADDVMQHLRRRPNGQALAESRSGLVLEAYLMAADPNVNRVTGRQMELKKIVESQSVDTEAAARRRATDLMEMCRRVPGPMRDGISLSTIARKIDLAANVQG